jgi:hypothetical protein
MNKKKQMENSVAALHNINAILAHGTPNHQQGFRPLYSESFLCDFDPETPNRSWTRATFLPTRPCIPAGRPDPRPTLRQMALILHSYGLTNMNGSGAICL